MRCSATEALQHNWFRENVNSADTLPTGIVDNLKKYMKQANLKNVLMNMMAHQLDVTGSQIKQINKLFVSLDKDQNGLLSAEELIIGLRTAGMQPWEVSKIIQALDIDGSGKQHRSD